MADELRGERLQTESLVIGYAMSRLDKTYLAGRGVPSWQDAFAEATDALRVKSSSFKNLRDEFDPVHPNPRSGWHQRPMRDDRLRVMGDLAAVSDEALLALVDRILAQDEEATNEAIQSLATESRTAYNVAQRLLTGRMAEEFFLDNCQKIVDISSSDIVDMRQAACGYDFGVTRKEELAIEVKGLKTLQGAIQFTDREWTVAGERSADYWVVVVGNLAADPLARLFRDPRSLLSTTCRFQTIVAAVWQAQVSVVP